MNKIYSREKLKKKIDALRDKGKKIVFTKIGRAHV
jgi:biotin operon repressor